MQIKGHTDDVNAIAYLDDSNNILISGSDDTLVKVCIPMQVPCNGLSAGKRSLSSTAGR